MNTSVLARLRRAPTATPAARPALRRAVEQLRHLEWLDAVGDPARDSIQRNIPEGVRQNLRGRWLGHPLHPTLSDLPIGLWLSSVVLDTADGEGSQAAADRLLYLGIAAAVPTAWAGMLDWAESSRGSRRQGLVHAFANTVALALFSWSALARRHDRRRGRVLSLGAATALGVGAYLGGHLTYAEGVGVEARAATERADPPAS